MENQMGKEHFSFMVVISSLKVPKYRSAIYQFLPSHQAINCSTKQRRWLCCCLLWFRFIGASKPGGRTEFQAKTAVWRALLKQRFVPKPPKYF